MIVFDSRTRKARNPAWPTCTIADLREYRCETHDRV